MKCCGWCGANSARDAGFRCRKCERKFALWFMIDDMADDDVFRDGVLRRASVAWCVLIGVVLAGIVGTVAFIWSVL